MRYLGGLLLFVASAASASPDWYGMGDGHHGAVTFSTSHVVNRYAGLTAAVNAGDAQVPVTAASLFTAGDLVLLVQLGAQAAPDAGDPGPFGLTASNTGRWELARVEAVSASALRLSAPLSGGFPVTAQVVLVPEYTDVTITAGLDGGGAEVSARPWDGRTGGVLAFLASGTVTNHGRVHANGAGFRGGATARQPNQDDNCALLDEPGPRGAQKGEGIASARFGPSHTGYGNVANAGGGGNCNNAGGGGGGHAGPGGKGGKTVVGRRDVGGRGGAELLYSPYERLVPGGGGGAGHQPDYSASGGAAGGGVVFVRAAQVTGSGRFEAHGASASNALNIGSGGGNDGAGGGGAGGLVYLRVGGAVSAGLVGASGGDGGSTGYVDHGPGGGGGGGRILLQGSGAATVPVVVNCGVAGTAGGANTHGGEPLTSTDPMFRGEAIVNPLPVTLPPTPAITSPGSGTATANARPVISGTAASGLTVRVFADGLEIGQAVASAGTFRVAPSSDLADGVHELIAATQSSSSASLGLLSTPSTPAVTLTVDRTPPDTSLAQTPPDTTLVQDAIFDMASDEAGATFQCRLDGAAFAACADPKSYTGLALGMHRFEARAVDAVGNVDPTPVSYAWTIGLPNTSLTEKPPAESAFAEATFRFTADGTGATFECKLDAQAFAACNSPHALNGLSDGTHTFAVRARVGTAVDPSPVTHSWTVNTQPPDTTLTSGPPAIGKSRTASFTFESSKSPSSFECRQDPAEVFVPCTSPHELSDLKDGNYALEVRAQDAAGRVDPTPATWTWTVDNNDFVPLLDAGAPDAGGPAEPSPPPSGCGCGAGGATTGGAALTCWLLAFAGRARRRRV